MKDIKTKKSVWQCFAISIFAFIFLNICCLSVFAANALTVKAYTTDTSATTESNASSVKACTANAAANASVDTNHLISIEDKKIYNMPIDLSKYPDSSAIVLYNSTNMIIHKDLSYTKTRRIVIKILDYRGKKENSEKKIYFDKRYEKVHLYRAVTIKKNGGYLKVIPAYKNAVKILDVPYEAGFMDYAVHKMEVVAFADVDSGNIVDLTYSITGNKRQPFSDKVFFGYKEPVLKMIYKIVLPKSLKIIIKGPAFKEKIIGNSRTLIWNASNLSQIIKEHNMPENDLIVPVMYYSLYSGWAQFRDNLLQSYGKNIKVTSDVKKLVSQITAQNKNKFNKVKKISLFLAKRIENKKVRDIETFRIRPVDKIIASGYAASFDRTALFLSMMKDIGIKGYPVAVGPKLLYWNKEKNAVQTEDFTKIIAKITLNGKQYYIDSSNEFYPMGYMENENRIGMEIIPGKIRFTKLTNKGKFRNREKIDYTIRIKKNGEAEIFYEHTFQGQKAVIIRNRYKYMTPVQRMQNYQKILGAISQNAVPISKTMSINLNYPVKISYKYLYRHYAVTEKNYLYFDIPSKLVPFKLNKSPEHRKYPFVSTKNQQIDYNIKIKYPCSLNPVIIPDDVNLKGNMFSVNRTIKTKKGQLMIKDNIIKKYGLVGKKDYADFYNKNMKLSHPGYYKVLLNLN